MAGRAWRSMVGVGVVMALSGSAVAVSTSAADLSRGESVASEGLASAERETTPSSRITLGFVGDVHMHRAVNRSALRPDGSWDYRPMFDTIEPLIGWFDVAICHLEQPIAPPGSPVFVEPPLLSSHAALAEGLARGGFDRCGTASNHAMDRGVAGIDATLNSLDSAGIGHAGTARTAPEAFPALFTVNGVTIAHLAYTFGLYISRPAGEPWRVNLTDPSRIIADARWARQVGADVVIVDMEWGIDRVVQPTAEQRALASTITASGEIDLIVGHQAHVLQPISQVNGTWVVWGLGNIVSDHPTSSLWPAASQDGAVVMVEVTFDGKSAEVGRPVVYPTWCDRTNGHVVLPTTLASDLSLPAWKRAALAASTERTRSVLGDFFAPGL